MDQAYEVSLWRVGAVKPRNQEKSLEKLTNSSRLRIPEKAATMPLME